MKPKICSLLALMFIAVAFGNGCKNIHKDTGLDQFLSRLEREDSAFGMSNRLDLPTKPSQIEVAEKEFTLGEVEENLLNIPLDPTTQLMPIRQRPVAGNQRVSSNELKPNNPVQQPKTVSPVRSQVSMAVEQVPGKWINPLRPAEKNRLPWTLEQLVGNWSSEMQKKSTKTHSNNSPNKQGQMPVNPKRSTSTPEQPVVESTPIKKTQFVGSTNSNEKKNDSIIETNVPASTNSLPADLKTLALYYPDVDITSLNVGQIAMLKRIAGLPPGPATHAKSSSIVSDNKIGSGLKRANPRVSTVDYSSVEKTLSNTPLALSSLHPFKKNDSARLPHVPEAEHDSIMRSGFFETPLGTPSKPLISNNHDLKNHDITPLDSKLPLDWNDRIQQTIDVLSSELKNLPTSQVVDDAARLRLLFLLSGNMIRATEPISNFSPEEQNCWRNQLSSINKMMQLTNSNWKDTTPIERRRALRECMVGLREAAECIRDSVPIELLNPNLCTAIDGFAQYTVADDESFVAGQPILMYCEVDNLSNQEKLTDSPNQSLFETRIQGHIEIVDTNDKSVFQFDYPVVTDESRRPRRDFFVYFPLEFPKLPAGEYRIRVSVQDMISNRSASIEETTFKLR